MTAAKKAGVNEVQTPRGQVAWLLFFDHVEVETRAGHPGAKRLLSTIKDILSTLDTRPCHPMPSHAASMNSNIIMHHATLQLQLKLNE